MAFLMTLTMFIWQTVSRAPPDSVLSDQVRPLFVHMAQAEPDIRFQRLVQRCRAVMATSTTMAPSWVVASTCYAVHTRDPTWCATDDWPCVLAAVLSDAGTSSDPCAFLPAGQSLRACRLVTDSAEMTGICPLAVDSRTCDGAGVAEVADTRAALERFRQAWQIRKREDRSALDVVCSRPFKTFRDKAARCACAEWARQARPGAGMFEGCPRCVKMRPGMEPPLCPLALSVTGPPESRIVTNPSDVSLNCWVVGMGGNMTVKLPPGISRTFDGSITGLKCLPDGP